LQSATRASVQQFAFHKVTKITNYWSAVIITIYTNIVGAQLLEVVITN